MKHQALYRMYRPKRFSEVIGQRHITLALTNQIKTNSLSHAYIFNGTRGVGKTSVARILARAVNCLNNQNGEPCMKCKACLDYEGGGNVDIIEIDAASNNGVQDARELADRVTYAPNYSKYKVYIIDEAHMITNNAFNALLKTIEEPPEHAIFILCTTEVQAFPATILSRCMRFDFHMVSVENLTMLLAKIFDDLKISYTKEALSAMALAGEGSVRDTLTVADRCVALCKDQIDYQTVLEVLGATNRQTIIDLANSILKGDTKTLLETTVSLVNEGKSVSVLARDLCKHMRDLAVIATCGEAREVLRLPEELYIALKNSAENTDIKKLLNCVDIFSSLEYRLRTSLSPQLLFEAAALKLAVKEEDDFLEKRISRLEKLIAAKNTDSNGSQNGGSNALSQEKKIEEVSNKKEKTEIKQEENAQKPQQEIVIPPQSTHGVKESKREETAAAQDNVKAQAQEKKQEREEKSIPSQKQEKPLTQPKAQEKEGQRRESASLMWADVLNFVKENATPLVKTICQGIGKVEVVNNSLRVYCNPAQYNVLSDKENSMMFCSALKKYGVTFCPVREEAAATSAGLEGIMKSGINVERK